eukprot:m.79731 g.79731  ORF g.79731 m.79731 type:complete len:194 (+) comp12577_c2_seq1:873-1454(+)
MAGEESQVARGLYGGAATVMVPARFKDVSDARQIPDHQEVFVAAETDQSVIVELVEQGDMPLSEAATYYFDNLATDNSAQAARYESDVHTSTTVLEDGSEIGYSQVVGVQTIAKFNEANANEVRVYLCCIRLAHVTTDVLITLNTPIDIDPESCVAETVDLVRWQQHSSAQYTQSIFDQAVSSFGVSDWSLFG